MSIRQNYIYFSYCTSRLNTTLKLKTMVVSNTNRDLDSQTRGEKHQEPNRMQRKVFMYPILIIKFFINGQADNNVTQTLFVVNIEKKSQKCRHLLQTGVCTSKQTRRSIKRSLSDKHGTHPDRFVARNTIGTHLDRFVPRNTIFFHLFECCPEVN